MVDRLNRKAMKRADTEGKLSADTGVPSHMKMNEEALERMGQEGKYSVFVLYAAPENAQPYVIVPIRIPNKKEYRRIKRQMLLVRKGLKKVMWFKNAFGQWQSINSRGHLIISVCAHAVEGRTIDTPEGKKKIIIAGEDAPHFN